MLFCMQDFADTDELAASLMLLYKDETSRNEVIAKGQIIPRSNIAGKRQVSQLWKAVSRWPLNLCNRKS